MRGIEILITEVSTKIKSTDPFHFKLMVTYTHPVYVTCYFSYMLFNVYLVHTSYYYELVVGLRTQFCTLLEVWWVWELGC